MRLDGLAFFAHPDDEATRREGTLAPLAGQTHNILADLPWGSGHACWSTPV